jgi:hypothetical protein
LWMPNGYKINVALGTAGTNGWVLTGVGYDF